MGGRGSRANVRRLGMGLSDFSAWGITWSGGYLSPRLPEGGVLTAWGITALVTAVERCLEQLRQGFGP